MYLLACVTQYWGLQHRGHVRGADPSGGITCKLYLLAVRFHGLQLTNSWGTNKEASIPFFTLRRAASGACLSKGQELLTVINMTR